MIHAEMLFVTSLTILISQQVSLHVANPESTLLLPDPQGHADGYLQEWNSAFEMCLAFSEMAVEVERLHSSSDSGAAKMVSSGYEVMAGRAMDSVFQ